MPKGPRKAYSYTSTHLKGLRGLQKGENLPTCSLERVARQSGHLLFMSKQCVCWYHK